MKSNECLADIAIASSRDFFVLEVRKFNQKALSHKKK